jgi:uncharacterized membrane protein YuzA (DUF378 family)
MTPTEAFQKNPIMVIANILVILGALNWLGVALNNGTNLLVSVTGNHTKNVLILIGLSGVYLAYYKIMWFLKPTMKNEVVEHLSCTQDKKGGLKCQ